MKNKHKKIKVYYPKGGKQIDKRFFLSKDYKNLFIYLFCGEAALS